jgi:hypothetical protein
MSATPRGGTSGGPGNLQRGKGALFEEDVDGFEDCSFERLVQLVDALAPHLLQSFICLRKWWEDRRGEQEAHVSFRLIASCRSFLNTTFQMLKYMLYRTICTGIILFSDVEAPSLDVCKKEFAEYNGRARAVWNSPKSFFDRQKACDVLLEAVVPSCQYVRRSVEDEDLRRFPTSISGQLNAIFEEHYDSKDKWLLFGRTEEKAYDVQDRYALSVVELLGDIDERYASRAYLCLRGLYGRGAPLPLLCESSISAMWEVCQDSYYKRQITLAS